MKKAISLMIISLLVLFVCSCGDSNAAVSPQGAKTSDTAAQYSPNTDTEDAYETASGYDEEEVAIVNDADELLPPDSDLSAENTEQTDLSAADQESKTAVETASAGAETESAADSDASASDQSTADTAGESTSTVAGDGNFSITTSDGTVTKNGNIYTVSSAGTYVLTGKLADGQVRINAGDSDTVELDLNGVSISCSSDSPVYAVNADKVKIVANAGTVNTVTDARTAAATDNDTTGAAAIYALCDLHLSGTGALQVVVNRYNNGVHTKDDLKIKEITLTVTAPNNAIKGNDSVTIESGALTLVSTGGDAIKTDNSDVSSKGNQRGTVTISGGSLSLTAADDGIDAAYDVVISGGSVTVVKASGKGIAADNSVSISGGAVAVTYAADDAIHANNDVALENGASPTGNVTISGGTVTVTRADDDGIHADGTLLVSGGAVTIAYSHEGMEGHYITIENGTVYVYATDDAINATSSSSGTADGLITVSGGFVVAEVSGRDVDGIDSNGSYTQTGGFVVVSNPNADSGGNMSALDVDNTVTITGGIIVALGTVPGNAGGGFGGMGGMGAFGIGGRSSSSLPSGYVTFSGALSAGSHSFTYGGNTYTFSLKNAVSGGWIWASGISSSNYALQ